MAVKGKFLRVDLEALAYSAAHASGQRRQRNVAEHRLNITGQVPPVLRHGFLLHAGQRSQVLIDVALDGMALLGRGRPPDLQGLSWPQPVAHILKPKRLGMGRSASAWSLKLDDVCLPSWTYSTDV